MTLPQYPERESKALEFKESLPSNLGQIIKTCVAFANGSGGEILIGIEDQTRHIIGVKESDIERAFAQIPNSIYDAIRPPIIPEVYERNISDRIIIVISISKGNTKPYAIGKDGIPKGVYVRIGSHTRRAAPENVEEIMRDQKRIAFDQEPSPAKRTDLDMSLLQEIYGSPLSDNLLLREGVSTETPMREVCLTQGGLLMFGQHPEQWVPEATIICTHFKGIAGRDIIETRELTGSIPVLANSCLQLLSAWLERGYIRQGAQLRGKLPLPQVALREAVINALIHRKYTLVGAIKVALYDDRLEVFSPGAFPGIISVNNLGDGSTYLRNPLIAKFARKLRLVEKLGSGIKEIFRSCAAMGLRSPDFFEDGDFVKVVFYFEHSKTKPRDLEALILSQLEERGILRVKDVLDLAKVSRNTVTNTLNKLVGRKLVKRQGQGRGVSYSLAKPHRP